MLRRQGPGIFAAVIAAGAGAWALPAAASEPAQLIATVSLDKDSFRAGETVLAEVWLTNPTDTAFQDLELRLARPGFIHLASFSPDDAAACGDDADHPSLRLGALAAHSTLAGRLCLPVERSVEEGDFHLLFAFRYGLAEEGRVSSEVVTIEKQVQIGLLGTETVAGFSLRLVALVLPGLLFWLVLQLFGFGGAIQSTIDKGALAVLSSAVLLGLATAVHLPWIAAGSSFQGLLLLCVCGAGLGLAAALGLRQAKAWRSKRRRDRMVQWDDPPLVAMLKLLKFSGKVVLRNPRLQLKDRQELSGCLMGPAAGGVVVLASFQLSAEDPLRQQLRALAAESKWVDLIERAVAEHLQPAIVEAVRKWAGRPDAEWQDAGAIYPLERSDVVNSSERGGSWVPISLG